MDFIPSWALGVGVIIIAASVAKAVSAMFRSNRSLHSADTEAAELRQTVETLQQRLSDVEERLDFAERLLAKQRDADRLGSPPR